MLPICILQITGDYQFESICQKDLNLQEIVCIMFKRRGMRRNMHSLHNSNYVVTVFGEAQDAKRSSNRNYCILCDESR